MCWSLAAKPQGSQDFVEEVGRVEQENSLQDSREMQWDEAAAAEMDLELPLFKPILCWAGPGLSQGTARVISAPHGQCCPCCAPSDVCIAEGGS